MSGAALGWVWPGRAVQGRAGLGCAGLECQGLRAGLRCAWANAGLGGLGVQHSAGLAAAHAAAAATCAAGLARHPICCPPARSFDPASWHNRVAVDLSYTCTHGSYVCMHASVYT